MPVEATVFTNSLTTLALEYELDALNLLMAPSAAVNCATHIGTKIDIRPLRSAFALMALAVPAGNPTAPHKAGRNRGNSAESDVLKEAPPRFSLQNCWNNTHDGLLCLRTRKRARCIARAA